MEEQSGALVAALHEALPYVSSLVGKTLVVKLGGSTMGSHDTTLEDVVTLKKLGAEPVLVHGGGSEISRWLKRIGKEPKFVGGLRVTDDETLEVALMVLAGKVNKELVAGLIALGARAVGISGIDGAAIRARRKSEELGHVGEVTQVDLALLTALTGSGYIPVIAPVGVGPQGECLNINADTAAAEVAVALRAEKLVFLTDVAGVCDAAGRLIPELSAAEARELMAQGVASGGMIPKVEGCLRALGHVRRTHIIDGRIPHSLLRELFTEKGVGTMIVQETSEVGP